MTCNEHLVIGGPNCRICNPHGPEPSTEEIVAGAKKLLEKIQPREEVMKMIRAKFNVSHIKTTRYHPKMEPQLEIQFGAVYSKEEGTENYSFSKATPNGTISLTVDNPGAIAAFEKAFEEGKSFYVDFTPIG